MKNTKFPLPQEVLGVYSPLYCVWYSFICEHILYKRNNRRKRIPGLHSTRMALFYLVSAKRSFDWLPIIFLFFKSRELYAKRDSDIKQYFDQFKYEGINPGDCDYIWFDFSGGERAKIVILGDAYYPYVELFNYQTESWIPVNTVSVFSSLSEIKKILFYEFHFFCEENTLLDEHGDEVFKNES